MRDRTDFIKFNHLEFILPHIISLKFISREFEYIYEIPFIFGENINLLNLMINCFLRRSHTERSYEFCLLKVKIDDQVFTVDFDSIKNYE